MAKTTITDYNNSRSNTVIGDDDMRIRTHDWSAHEKSDHIPNAETLAAMKEADERLRQLETGEIKPRFSNISEFFISLFSEEDDE